MSFQLFNSFDDAMASMRKAEEEANKRVTPEQADIGYGDYWMRVWQGFGETVKVYGYIQTLEESLAQEKECGADEEELRMTEDMLTDSYIRGYRFGYAYSAIEPEGELGSTHISQMIKISKEDFEAAKERGWR